MSAHRAWHAGTQLMVSATTLVVSIAERPSWAECEHTLPASRWPRFPFRYDLFFIKDTFSQSSLVPAVCPKGTITIP